MESQTWLIIVGVMFVFLLVIIAAFALVNRRATGGSNPAPVSQQWVAGAKIEPGERESSLVSEEIEELVRAKLAAYPDLAHAKLDFGSTADGSLEIWIDQTHYRSAEEIPDPRLRQAVQAAVREWND
jgi:hypothetical protein